MEEFDAALLAAADAGWSYRPGMDDPGGGPFDDDGTATMSVLFG